MVVEIEKVNNRYRFKIKVKQGVLVSKFSYSTKSDAIRGFNRFRIKEYSEVNVEKIYIKDKEQRKMYHYIYRINELPLSKPIKVSIEKEDGEYLATIDNLKLYSYGNSLSEVVGELKTDLSYIYKRLFIDDVKAGKNALMIKKELLKYLK